MGVLPAFMYVYNVSMLLWRPEEGIGYPGNGVIYSC